MAGVHCVNIEEPLVQELSKEYSVHPAAIAAKIAVWQEANGLDKWPSRGDIGFVDPSTLKTTEELLKEVRVEPKGLLYAETMMPAWSAEFLKDFVDKDGNLDFEKAKKELPSEIWDMIAYRIPTEAKYSMMPLRVVGFLPIESGGALMLPAEITTIAGLDFDVDKEYVMMKSFKRVATFNASKLALQLREDGFDVETSDIEEFLKHIKDDSIELTEQEQEMKSVIDEYADDMLKLVQDVKYIVPKYNYSRNPDGTLIEQLVNTVKPYKSKNNLEQYGNHVYEYLGLPYTIKKEEFKQFSQEDIKNFTKQLPIEKLGTSRLRARIEDLIDNYLYNKIHTVITFLKEEYEMDFKELGGILDIIKASDAELKLLNMTLPQNHIEAARYVELLNYYNNTVKYVLDAVAEKFDVEKIELTGYGENDVYIPNRILHRNTTIEELLSIEQPKQSGIKQNLSTFVNHSGGAYGGDTMWDIIGREYGVTTHKHYRDSANTTLSKQLRDLGVQAEVLTKEQIETARAAIEELLGKKYPDTLEGNLQVRNYYQVSMSDAVFAIAKLNGNAEFNAGSVHGGTNTAVQLGIKLNKPVYLWDIDSEQWMVYTPEIKDGIDVGEFKPTDTPVLTKNFAGIGSRDIENYNIKSKDGSWNPRKQYVGDAKAAKAKQAIKDVYEKTQTTTEQSETPTAETKINIYAGTGENAELSNFAARPFRLGDDVIYPTVEHAFQLEKLQYSTAYTDAQKEAIVADMITKSASVVKAFGKTIKGVRIKEWDKDASITMKQLLLNSFEQNPDALQKLLATGNATLTHTQDKTKWGTEFPKLLMEVRSELRPQIETTAETTVKEGVFDKELAVKMQEKLEVLYPEISLNITNTPVWENGDNVFDQKSDIDAEVQYRLKAADILLSDKAKQIFAKGEKNKWSLDKILTELAIPKEQKKLLLDLNISDREDLALELTSRYGYNVEINTAKDASEKAKKDSWSRAVEQGLNPWEEGIDNDFQGEPTQHYSNLTVPGGTNYTENEISTPLITPSIQGHAQFSTDKGIGWFRSDEQVVGKKDFSKVIEDEDGGIDFEFDPNIVTKGDITNTRRILEIQSDLFQKGRDKEELVKSEDIIRSWDNPEFQKLIKDNSFLQLLNKDSNWVTFFIKSIIQDSAKKGYEKILFPKGETAAKIEGHETIADEIRKIDKEIELTKNSIKGNLTNFNKGSYNFYINNGKYYKGEIDDPFGVSKPISKDEYEKAYDLGYIKDRLIVLEQQKSNLKSQGIEKLKPIEAFYEIKVGNILEKQFGKDDIKTVVDEYGNEWREITINQARDLQDILLQKDEANNIIGQANITAATVLIDAINQKQDTLPHEYAHHYIAWNRSSPIVQEAIKKWGSEEALVQSIGEQAVAQKGEAWDWWKKFVNWLLGDLRKLSQLDKNRLTQILTDAFLTRQDLSQIGEAKPQSREARDNALIDLQLAILRDSSTVSDIITPGGFSYLESIAKVVNDKRGIGKTPNRHVFDLFTMDEAAIRNTTGIALKGIAANNTSHAALRQHYDLRLSKPLLFDKKEFTSLSGKKASTQVTISKDGKKVTVVTGDKVERTISQNFGEISAAVVDNAKNPVAAFINYTLQTSEMFSLLVGGGLDPHTASFFVSQPIVLHAIQLAEKHGKPLHVIMRGLLKENGIGMRDLAAVNLSTQELYDALGTSDITTGLQISVLKSYVAYSKSASDLGKLIRACLADTKGLQATIAYGEVLLNNIEQVTTDPRFSINGAREMLTVTGKHDLIAHFTGYGVSKPMFEVLNQAFPYTSYLFDSIKREINDNLYNRNLTEKERNFINKQIVNYLTSDFDYFNVGSRGTFIYDFPNTVLKLQQLSTTNPEVNTLAGKLLSVLGVKNGEKTYGVNMNTIEINTIGKLTDEQIDGIKRTWLDLFELTEDVEGLRTFAHNLVRYAYHTKGLSFALGGMGHLIPAEAFIKHIVDSRGHNLSVHLETAAESAKNASSYNEIAKSQFVDQFYRHNYDSKSKFVPKVITAKTAMNVSTISEAKITINPATVKFDNLFTTRYERQGGESVAFYYPKPFIIHKGKLYKATTVETTGIIEYVRTFKLGIPNFMNEYTILNPVTKSYYNPNNVSVEVYAVLAAAQKKVETNDSVIPSDQQAEDNRMECNQ